MSQNQHDDSGSETPKRYVKPEIRQVNLTPEEAVLGSCKTISFSGPAQATCTVPAPCSSQGS